MLTLNSLANAANRVPVLDQWLSAEARRAGRRVQALETPLEQCRPLNNLGEAQVNFALHQLLRRAEQQMKLPDGKEQSSDLVLAYNCGTLDAATFDRDTTVALARDATDSDRRRAAEIDAYFRRTLLSDRNRRMAQRILLLLTQRPHRHPPLIALGAGHFFGLDSIVELLRAAGYRVEEVANKRRPIDLGELSAPVDLHQTPVIQDLWVRDDSDWLALRRRQRTLQLPIFFNNRGRTERREPLALSEAARERIYEYVMYNRNAADSRRNCDRFVQFSICFLALFAVRFAR